MFFFIGVCGKCFQCDYTVITDYFDGLLLIGFLVGSLLSLTKVVR